MCMTLCITVVYQCVVDVCIAPHVIDSECMVEGCGDVGCLLEGYVEGEMIAT